MSAWPERVAALNGAEDRITRFVEDHVAPFLIRRTAVASLYHDAEVGFAPVPSAHAYDLRALLRERELENLAFNKQALELIALRQIEELEERVGRILAGIESQVD